MQARRIAAVLVAAGLASLGPAAAAPAPALAPPRDFLGMNVDGPALQPASRVPGHLRKMAGAGVRSVRWAVYWPQMQPYASSADVPADRRGEFRDVGGVPTDFRATDRFIAAAARARLDVLPVVIQSAPWAAEDPLKAWSPPTDAAAFGRFAGALTARYGARGALWRGRPGLRRRPVRTWQVWNEPAGINGFTFPSHFWASSGDSLKGYLALLTAARQNIRLADPRARLMLSGLFGRPWLAMRELYAAGARSAFDVVGIHPFTRRPRNVVRILDNVRRVMARHGDRRKPMVVTETSWPSARPRVYKPQAYAVTERGQAKVLVQAYRELARQRRRLRLEAIYWYTWMTRDRSENDTFEYAGLVTSDGSRRLRRKPAFFAFKDLAERFARERRRAARRRR